MIIFLSGSSGVGKTSIAKILLKKLPNFYFFEITCEIEEMRERTYKRRDARPLKFMDEHYNFIKSLGFQFDLELNTSFISSESCVDAIIKFIENEKNPSGFYDTVKKFKEGRKKLNSDTNLEMNV